MKALEVNGGNLKRYRIVKLTGTQRKVLRGLAHGIKPLIHVGRRGLTDELFGELSRTLDSHELVKIRFSDFKEDKKELCAVIEERLSAENVGIIGHHAIFYRQQPDPEKRKINI